MFVKSGGLEQNTNTNSTPSACLGTNEYYWGGGGVYQFITHLLLSIVSILFFLYQIKAVKIFSGILLHN